MTSSITPDRTATTRTDTGPVSPTVHATNAVRPLAGNGARITGGFWHIRQQRNGAAAIRSGYQRLEDAGNLHNLRLAAGAAEGGTVGPIFMDSDVYKWLEAVAWEYGRAPAEDLLVMQRDVTALIAAAQEDDGYLDSVHSVQHGVEGRYSDLPWSHELYCAGHLFQAAVAQVRATGDRALLDVAIRLADHLVTTFGDAEGQIRDVDGHPVVEMGLVELYRETGSRAYLDLARWCVDARGKGLIAEHGKEPTYFADRVPVRTATTVEGHAVRAVYLTAGATDVAVEDGDTLLLQRLREQFDAMLASKTFITGGLGARWEGEAFGDPFELPSDRGYAETCAAIGGIQWAHRLLLATGESKYAAAVERLLYNAFLPGVSLEGTEYFYVNPLQLRADADPDDNRSPANGRRGWFECACCPPNIMRMFASVAAYAATETSTGLQVQQYMTGEYAGAAGAIEVRSDLPFRDDTRVRITRSSGEWTLSLRIPTWAESASIMVNGKPVNVDSDGGYLHLRRTFSEGDVVDLKFQFGVSLYRADPRIDSSRASVAIERGPLVYAVESAEERAHDDVDDIRLDPEADFAETLRDDVFPGLVALDFLAAVEARTPREWPYERVTSPLGNTDIPTDRMRWTAIPYFAWANRGVNPMRVWLPTSS